MRRYLARLLGTCLVAASLIVALTAATYPVPHCKVPKVAGDTISQAQAALNKANCKLGKLTTHSSKTVPKNHVISSSPAAGTKHNVGFAVNLKVSTGPPPKPGAKCKVPSVVGKTKTAATTALINAGCGVRMLTKHSSKVAKNRVISQRPAAGKTIKAGSKVTLVISSGKKTGPKTKKKTH